MRWPTTALWTRFAARLLAALLAFAAVASTARADALVQARTASIATTSFQVAALMPALQANAPSPAPAVLQDEPRRANRFTSVNDALDWNWDRLLAVVVAMAGAVLMSLPLALIYLRTKRDGEFDSSVLFSIVILAAIIAGVLVVVQGSVARALSLAGVVSAVRFRSSLNDTNDAVYLLGAIAVGLAAGSNALDAGVGISVLLSVTLLALWKVRVDAVRDKLLPSNDEKGGGHHKHHHKDDGNDPPTPLPAPSLVNTREPSPTAPAALMRSNGTSPISKKPAMPTPPESRVAYVVVETEHAERTRLLVEMFLERETKKWRLDGSTGPSLIKRQENGTTNGSATLLYLVRFRKSTPVEIILERLRTVGHSSDFTVRLEAGDDAVARPA